MTLSAILTIMTSAAAGFLAALFWRKLGQPPAAPDTASSRDPAATDETTAPSHLSLAQRNFAVVVVAGLVLGAVGLYALDDGPDLPSPPQTKSAGLPGASAVDRLAAALQGAEGQPPPTQSQVRVGTVDEMIARLVERLDRNPGDPEGWRMLGWSYFNTERFAQSAAAYAKAIALNPRNAELRSARGEALVRVADGRVTDEARAAFEEALRLDAKDPRGRFFIGLAKEQGGDKTAALDDWIAVLGDTDSKEAWAADLRQRVTELGKETGVDVSARLASRKPAATGGLLAMLEQPAAAGKPTPPTGRGPDADAVRNAAAMNPTDRTAMIEAMVDRLAGRLAQAPRDVEGWIKLMRSRQVLGDTDAAEQTFRLALDVFKDAPREQEQLSSAARELALIK
jgi:cytochrome c-type biogenesis protein CcmH